VWWQPSDNVLRQINEVILRRARLLLRWVTIRRHTVLACITSHPGQLSLLPSAEREMSTGQEAMFCSREGNRSSGVALHMPVVGLYPPIRAQLTKEGG